MSTHLSFKIPDLEYNYELLDIIAELGKDLCSINLLIVGRDDTFQAFCTYRLIDHIIEGCPKLKTLSLESLRGWKKSKKDQVIKYMSNLRPSLNFKEIFKDLDMSDCWDLTITDYNLKALSKGCKELKDLKFTKVSFEGDIFAEDDIKKILPDCNVEFKECRFMEPDEDD